MCMLLYSAGDRRSPAAARHTLRHAVGGAPLSCVMGGCERSSEPVRCGRQLHVGLHAAPLHPPFPRRTGPHPTTRMRLIRRPAMAESTALAWPQVRMDGVAASHGMHRRHDCPARPRRPLLACVLCGRHGRSGAEQPRQRAREWGTPRGVLVARRLPGLLKPGGIVGELPHRTQQARVTALHLKAPLQQALCRRGFTCMHALHQVIPAGADRTGQTWWWRGDGGIAGVLHVCHAKLL